MNFFLEIVGVVKRFLMPPTVVTSGYYIGQRVEYIDPSVNPTHYGTVISTWNDKAKVVFDGFEHGMWLETEAIRGVS